MGGTMITEHSLAELREEVEQLKKQRYEEKYAKKKKSLRDNNLELSA